MIPKIQTERLLLRAWKESDLAPYARMCADEETMRHMRTGTMTREETRWGGCCNSGSSVVTGSGR